MTSIVNQTPKILLLCLALVLACAPFLASAQSNEQGADVSNAEAARAARDYVLRQVGGDPLNVEGLEYCNNSALWVGLGETCGGVAQVDGSLNEWPSVTFYKGEILKCYWPPRIQDALGVSLAYGGPSCVVTNVARTEQRFFSDTWLGGSAALRADMQGNILDYSEQGALADAAETFLPSIFDTVGEVAGKMIWGVAWLIFQLATLLLALAGTLFNWVMLKAVFQFSTLIGASPGLLTAWSILRDIGNMLLLFGFIFIGIAMILDLHSYPAKKALPRLIIFAILMNFSLFIAGAVIDSSNGLSSVLYNQANDDPCATGASINPDEEGNLTQAECSVNYGISGHMMQSMGLASLFTAGDIGAGKIDAAPMVGLALFALVGAFVFFAAAIMLIIRAVVLTFLMVLAPIGFAALAIPTLEKHGKDWWNRLIHQSFFAPIFLLLVFVSLKITDSFAGPETRGSLAGALTHPEASVMGVIMVFGLVIGFLIFSLVAAKKFGAMGADFAVKTAGGLTAGTIGWAGRRTVGAASYNVGQNLSKTRFGQTAFGGAVARGAGSLGTKSLDLRGFGFVGSGAKAAGIGDIGKPDKDALKGYKGQLEAAAKKRTDYAESLEMTDEEKIKAAELKAERERIENKQKKSRRELDGARNEIEDNEKKKARLKTEINDATAREAESKLRGDLTGEASARSAAVTAHDALDQLDEKARSDAAELARIQSSFASEDGAYRKRLDEIKEDIEKNDPKGRYARSLVSTSKVMPPFTGNAARGKAAKKILGDLGKSEAQKLREALGNVNKGLTNFSPPSSPPSGGSSSSAAGTSSGASAGGAAHP